MSLEARSSHRDGSAVSVHRTINSPLLRRLHGSAFDVYSASAQMDEPAYRRAPLAAPPTAQEMANRLLRRESSLHSKRFDSADHVLEVAEEKLQKARLNLAQMRSDADLLQPRAQPALLASRQRDGRGHQLDAGLFG